MRLVPIARGLGGDHVPLSRSSRSDAPHRLGEGWGEGAYSSRRLRPTPSPGAEETTHVAINIWAATASPQGERRTTTYCASSTLQGNFEHRPRPAPNGHRGKPRPSGGCPRVRGSAPVSGSMRFIPIAGGFGIDVDRHGELHGWLARCFHHIARGFDELGGIGLRDLENELVVDLEQHAGA
jgi:hypothetical protein